MKFSVTLQGFHCMPSSSSYGTTAHIEACPPLYWGFLITHNWIQGRTPLDEWSARCRGLYLHRTTQHINTRQTSMTSAGFETSIPATKRPQTHALDRAATGIVWLYAYHTFKSVCSDNSLHFTWVLKVMRSCIATQTTERKAPTERNSWPYVTHYTSRRPSVSWRSQEIALLTLI
jgi:hypothetical protein